MTEPNSEGFGNVPNASADFGRLPHDSEPFGNIPKDSESFRTIRKGAERTDQHTLTVREAARLFEQAGVPRTERSIINWCQPNRQGVARLDAFFDSNERKYFITGQSVHLAIEEERAKQAANGAAAATPSDSAVGIGKEVPKHSEPASRNESNDSELGRRLKELEHQNRDLEITTRAKDYYIEQLTKEREKFHDQLLGMSRHVGELETQVLQLGGAPRGDRSLPNSSEGFGSTTRRAEHGEGARDQDSFPQD